MSIRSWSLFLHSGCRRILLSCSASSRHDISAPDSDTLMTFNTKQDFSWIWSLWYWRKFCTNSKWKGERTHVVLCRVWWQHSGVWGPGRRRCEGPGPQRCPPYSPSACSGLPVQKKKTDAEFSNAESTKLEVNKSNYTFKHWESF